MANQMILDAEVQAQIDEAVNKELDPERKKSLARSIKIASFSERKKANSVQTILSISNTLVGTSTLVFPVLFREVGIGTALLISIGIAFISVKTNLLLITHNKATELDLPDTILRILGNKWRVVYNVSNIILLWASGMIYMILICSQIYPVLCLILDSLNVPYAQQSEITFSKISYQWVGVFYFILSMPLMFQKNLGFLLKLIPFGSVSVVCFFCFIIFKGSANLASKGFNILTQMTWFTGEISKIAGVFTLALMIQSLIIPIAKNNKNQNNNKRDISIAYSWTWFLYQMIGIFGAISIYGIDPRDGTKGSTVLEYFKVNWSVIVIQILLFFQLSFVFPVLQFIVRSQLLGLIYDLQTPPNWLFNGFSVLYSLTCLMVQVFEVELSLMLSLSGAIIGLFQIYVIPIVLHLTCLYGKKSQVEEEAIKVQIQRQSNNPSTFIDTEGLISHIDFTQFSQDQDNINLSCNDHSTIIQKLSQPIRYAIYGILIVIGSYVAITAVISTFTQK